MHKQKIIELFNARTDILALRWEKGNKMSFLILFSHSRSVFVKNAKQLSNKELLEKDLILLSKIVFDL